MTSIKCPPPKIVAVKRSLRKPTKKNIMDDDELSVKDDFINDDDSLSSFDARDLIEFERDELLIDLSEDEPPAVQKSPSRDTVSSMNAKNSSTLLSLLDMLEIGNVTRAREMTRVGSCAEDDVSDRNPFALKTSSSSSSRNIPVECPGACATSSGKTDKLSSVFPPLSIQLENPSIVKNCSHHPEKLNCNGKATLSALESEAIDGQRVREGIDEKFIDSTLQNSHQCQSEKSEENLVSTSISFACSGSDCSIKSCCCTRSEHYEAKHETSLESSNKGKEIFNFCHYNHQNQQQQQQQNDVNSNAQLKVREASDANNNRETVCNQNSVEVSRANHEVDGGGTSRDDSNESLKFLSPHTSQRKLPPKFYSSTSSLNQDCFEASSRLKRLEERFKGFSYTKKLLRSSKLFSKSEEILSSYGRAREFKSCESLNSSIHFPLSSTTLSENCLRQLTGEEGEDQKDHNKDIVCDRKASPSDGISGEFSIR